MLIAKKECFTHYSDQCPSTFQSRNMEYLIKHITTTLTVMVVLFCGQFRLSEAELHYNNTSPQTSLSIAPVTEATKLATEDSIALTSVQSTEASIITTYVQPADDQENIATRGHPTTKKTQPQEDKGCLRMTFNDTNELYKQQKYLWFISMMVNTTIRLDFDSSTIVEGDIRFPDYSKYRYPTQSGKWHKIQLSNGEGCGCEADRVKLMIEEIQVCECLPHSNVNHVRVSSKDKLVLWSTCSPQGQWWNEIEEAVGVTNSERLVPHLSGMAACFIVALVVIALVGIYAWDLKRKLKQARIRRTQEEEPVYADWDSIRPPGVVMPVTPPSSDSNGTNSGTLTTVSS